LGRQFKRKSPDALFTIGVLNGLLPCGLVYAALFGAIAMQSVTFSISYMLLYGLGTIPLMSAMVYVSNFLSLPFRNKLQKIVPIVTVIIGLLFVLRGMGLDIAYISPSNINLFVQSTANCH
jgi:sulfite exporter TauE/SafE